MGERRPKLQQRFEASIAVAHEQRPGRPEEPPACVPVGAAEEAVAGSLHMAEQAAQPGRFEIFRTVGHPVDSSTLRGAVSAPRGIRPARRAASPHTSRFVAPAPMPRRTCCSVPVGRAPPRQDGGLPPMGKLSMIDGTLLQSLTHRSKVPKSLPWWIVVGAVVPVA